MPKILLYQPYYHFPGHFRSLFGTFHAELIKLGYSCVGLIGILRTDPIVKSSHITSFKCLFKNRTLRILNNVIGLSRLQKIIRTESVQAVHFLDIEILLLYLFVRLGILKLNSLRVVITQHSINRIRSDHTSLTHRIYRRLIHHSYNYLDRNLDLIVLTNGKNISAELVANGYLSEKKVITTWWGSSYNSVSNNLQEKRPNSFLLYGILRKDKNLDFLLENFSKVNRPYILHIAGYPRDYSRNQIDLLIEKYKIPQECISWELGYLSDSRITELLATSQYILLPYSSDNLSNSGPMMDAIQFGCIPIVSGYGERLEFIQRFDLGYIFFYEKKPSLCDILNQCLANSDQSTYYQELINQKKKQFTWATIITKLVRREKIYSV